MSIKKKYSKATVILGPTTTGKTEVALQVARQLDGEVINGDKFYLFSKLDLLTGCLINLEKKKFHFIYRAY